MSTDNDNPPTPERLRDDPLTDLGKPRQIRRKLDKPKADQLVETIRRMLILDVNPGDIKRKIPTMPEFKGFRPRSIELYITIAKRRQHESIGESNDEALAKSLGYWSGKKQQAEARIQREQSIENLANRSLERCEKDFDDLRERVTEDSPLTERFEAIEIRRRNAIALREQARRTIFTSEMISKDAQREIDRLKGNHAPLKFAKTDSKGQDVPEPEPIEPMTQEAVKEELKGLVEQLRNRQAAITVPSGN